MNSPWRTSLPHLNFRIQVRFSWLIGSQNVMWIKILFGHLVVSRNLSYPCEHAVTMTTKWTISKHKSVKRFGFNFLPEIFHFWYEVVATYHSHVSCVRYYS